MPSLSDALNPEQTLDQANATTGVQTAVTPLGATMQGAGPQAAKMAGTKIQKKSVQQEQERDKQSSEEMTYQDRLAQARTARTEAEESATKRAAQLQQLGSLGTRVENLIQSNITEGLSGAEAGVSVEEGDLGKVFTELEEGDQPAVLSLVNDYYSADPEKQQQILVDLSNLYGVTVDQSNIEDLVGGIEQSTGQAVADLTMDNVTVGNMGAEQLSQMGIADTAEMAELLGVPEEQVAGMTLADLISQVESVQAAEFGKVQELQRQLSDPAVSESERVAIRKQLRDLGGVGITGVEQQVESLADVVAEAGTITVGGKEMSVSDFLADDNFSKMITDLLSDSTDENTTEEIKKLLGEEAVDLIEQHSGAIDDLIKAGKKGVETFDTMQEERKNTAQALITEGRFDSEEDKELLDKLFPGWDKAGTSQHDWAGSDMYKAVSDPTDVDAALDTIFGEDVEVDDIQSQLDSLMAIANKPLGFKDRIFASKRKAKAEWKAKLKSLSDLLNLSDAGDIINVDMAKILRDKGPEELKKLGASLKDVLQEAADTEAKSKANQARIDADNAAKQAKEDVAKKAKSDWKDLRVQYARAVTGNSDPEYQQQLWKQMREHAHKHGYSMPTNSKPSKTYNTATGTRKIFKKALTEPIQRLQKDARTTKQMRDI